MSLQKDITLELQQIIQSDGLPVLVRKENWSSGFAFCVERVENGIAYGTAFKDGKEHHKQFGVYSYRLYEKFYVIKTRAELLAEEREKEAVRLQAENEQELLEALRESKRTINSFNPTDPVSRHGRIVDIPFDSQLLRALNPTGIAEEERAHLGRIGNTIELLIERYKNSITNPEKPFWEDSETGVGGAQVNSAINYYVSELEKNAGLQTDVESLEQSRKKPYFCHISLQFEDAYEPEDIFIGERLVYNYGEVVPTVISWQSPLGDLAVERNKTSTVCGTVRAAVQFKRNVVISDGVLNDVVETYNRLAKMADKDEAIVYDEFLIRILREKRTHKELTNIIPSIQQNQNQIIRAAQKENLIVQGCAGCGKTMILLHRISYLLYNYTQNTQTDYLVISPSKQFNRHLVPLLKNLRITKVPVRSISEYYTDVLCSYFNTWKEITDDQRLCSDYGVDPKFVEYFYSESYAQKLRERVDNRIRESKKNEERIQELEAEKKKRKDQNLDVSAIEKEISRLKLRRRISIFDDAFKDALPEGMKPGNRKIPICRAELYATVLANYFCYGPKNTFPFVFIDEGQDISKYEYILINSLNKEPIFNVYGDLDQRIHHYSISSWDDLKEIGTFAKYSINENYRNTTEITEFVNNELMLGMTAMGLKGTEPDLISVEKLREIRGKSSLSDRKAIIYTDEKSLLPVMDDLDGFDVYSVQEAKGMEFEIVVVLPDGMTENELYIAYTRALNELYLLAE